MLAEGVQPASLPEDRPVCVCVPSVSEGEMVRPALPEVDRQPVCVAAIAPEGLRVQPNVQVNVHSVLLAVVVEKETLGVSLPL